MFRAGNPFGVDLASINIQRGRDHGLRAYNDYRELVGQPRITSFDEFGPEVIKKLNHPICLIRTFQIFRLVK